MLKRLMSTTVVLLIVGGSVVAAIHQFSPSLWAALKHRAGSLTEWSEAARRADPVGYANYAKAQLQDDLEAMQTTRRELAAQLGELASKTREQDALREQARRLAEEIRKAYQEAVAENRFPIEVCGEAYTQEQAKAQVSLVLAEIAGYDQTLAKLNRVSTEAESKVEQLAVRINSTESSLAALDAQRELLRAQQLTDRGEQLLAQVDNLLHGNAEAIAGNPVRTVRELVAADGKHGHQPNRQAAEDFLAGKPLPGKPTVQVQTQNEVEPAAASQPTQQAKPKAKPAKSRTAAKPIFQQF